PDHRDRAGAAGDRRHGDRRYPAERRPGDGRGGDRRGFPAGRRHQRPRLLRRPDQLEPVRHGSRDPRRGRTGQRGSSPPRGTWPGGTEATDQAHRVTEATSPTTEEIRMRQSNKAEVWSSPLSREGGGRVRRPGRAAALAFAGALSAFTVLAACGGSSG